MANPLLGDRSLEGLHLGSRLRRACVGRRSLCRLRLQLRLRLDLCLRLRPLSLLRRTEEALFEPIETRLQ